MNKTIEKKLSVVICTYNSDTYLERIIKSVKAQDIKNIEIIVVDANSKDKTKTICKKNKVKLYLDSGIGIGNARNVGLKESTGEYILYLGPDNLIEHDKKFVSKLIDEMNQKKWCAITPMTFSRENNYIAYCMNKRWLNRIGSKSNTVIGSPFLFKKSILKKYKFNALARWSDDTVLCSKLKLVGLKFGYSDGVFAEEIGQTSLEKIKARFINYGISDFEFFNENKNNWGLFRKIKSILHPLSEFKTIKKISEIIAIPFILYIIFWRYIGYIRGYK